MGFGVNRYSGRVTGFFETTVRKVGKVGKHVKILGETVCSGLYRVKGNLSSLIRLSYRKDRGVVKLDNTSFFCVAKDANKRSVSERVNPTVTATAGIRGRILGKVTERTSITADVSTDVAKLKKGSREEIGEICSKTFDGKPIVTKCKINDEDFECTCIPQYQLSGFSDEEGNKYTYIDDKKETQEYKLYSSSLNSKDHVSNLWWQKISYHGEEISFMRSGSSRGNEQPTKELLLNAAIMQNGGKEGFEDLVRKREPIILNLSNIQLMTPGKLGDGDIPWKQMQRLLNYSDGNEVLIPYTYKDGDEEKTVDVRIELKEPLLFNFGVNFQHFKLGPLASSKDIDDQNAESFRKLFGANPSELGEGKLYEDDSILGKFLAENCKTQKEKERIEALAAQIINILKEHPRGIESNPYALPVRVMLLTSLIGYATTYGCKSGKDRTGVCSLELEALATKLLSSGKLYDPENTTKEEREILKQLYLRGEANKIADANTGKKSLKIKEFLGFNSLKKRFGVKLEDDPSKNYKNYLKEMGETIVELLKKCPAEEKAALGSIRVKLVNLMNKDSITLEELEALETELKTLTQGLTKEPLSQGKS